MRRRDLAILALTLLPLAAAPAWAHSPYFTQAEPIVLPDGRPGEMRLLHGDGIFFADPVRIVVLDRDKRLLARSEQHVPLSLICDRNRRSCWGYDHWSHQVLLLDPASFRTGGQVEPGAKERDGLWNIEAGVDSWGFTARDASIAEYIEAEWALARRLPVALAGVMALGGLMTVLGVVGLRRPTSPKWWRLGVWAAGILLRIAGTALAVIIALYFGVLIGFSLTTWLGALFVGASLVLLTRALTRRARAAAPLA
jgi:hypothetical protein